MSVIHGLGTNNLCNETKLTDRLTSIGAKLNDLHRIMRTMPHGNPELLVRFQAMVANELSRVQQFAWKLLKDVEAQERAAAMQQTDAQ